MAKVYLTIEKEDIDRIHQVVEHAHLHRLTVPTLKKMMKGKLPPIGDNPKHVAVVGNTLVCVFSVDATKDSKSYVKHLSVSTMDQESFPHAMLVNILLPYFGFDNPIDSDNLMLYPEEEKFAVNVIELLHPA